MELVNKENKKQIEDNNCIIDLAGINSIRYLKIEGDSFLALTCPSADGDDIYTIAIPYVCVKKFKKEELIDGESGTRSTRLQETAEGEEPNDGEKEGN